MPDGFVSLAVVLRGDDARARVETAAVPEMPDDVPAPGACDTFDVPGEIVRLRLAMHDAFEGAFARLLAGLAHDVLARELALRPADVDALVARALADYADHEPVEIAVSPGDANAVSARTSLALRVDDALAPGDLVVRVRDGAFESAFAFRVAHVLARLRTS